jgi:hypothetical protein
MPSDARWKNDALRMLLLNERKVAKLREVKVVGGGRWEGKTLTDGWGPLLQVIECTD